MLAFVKCFAVEIGSVFVFNIGYICGQRVKKN